MLNELKDYKFILGSTSPRRLEILANNLGIVDVTVLGSNYPEDLSKEGISKEEYVQKTSYNKARDILDQLTNGPPISSTVILTADTIVCCHDAIFEKPKTTTRQKEMFKQYKNYGTAEVITAVTAVKLTLDVNNLQVTTERNSVTSTTLTYNSQLSEEVITAYIESGEGLSVAGGFKFQEGGSILFSKIDGDYFNVVGLPVSSTFLLLQDLLRC